MFVFMVQVAVFTEFISSISFFPSVWKKSPENVYSTAQKETNHDYSLITVKVVPHSMSDLGFFSVGDNFIFFWIESDRTNTQEN
jgi:hypothetical protein